MMTGDHVKHINIDIRLKGIKTNGNEVILSPSYCSCHRCGMRSNVNFGSNFILVFDASELSDPNVPAENVRWREHLHSGEMGNASNLEAAINNTSIVAVFPNPKKQRQGHATKIKTFEFWRAECPTEGDDERKSLGKMERERIRNSRRREESKQAKKKKNIKHILYSLISR